MQAVVRRVIRGEILKDIKVNVGQYYTSVDKIFKVVKVLTEYDKTWVYYVNVKTNQEYNCLIDAFTNRFSLTIN
jgi:hypothetical protein